jgi:DNA modification methylase
VSVRILIGDARNQLCGLANESVHCVVTSPPYYGLRDYGVDGQLGLESTPDEYVVQMVAVFREVRRVLRDDGTLWLNIGDSYSAQAGQRKTTDKAGIKQQSNVASVGAPSRCAEGCKPKDLIGIPWMLAFALRADGWWLRQDILWSKPNPMPESVTDRCTKAHEYLFLLSKSARYHFDAAAIAEPTNWPEGSWARSKAYDGDQTGMLRSFYGNGSRWKGGETRNRRSVWEIATAPFPEAHFATFPPALVEPCILAGTSEKGVCGDCGAPWVRETERKGWSGRPNSGGIRGSLPSHHRGVGATQRSNMYTDVKTIGWSASCDCEAAIVPATVLDPFGGAGTTALVADRLSRNAVLIELNPKYAEMARKRIERDCPLFSMVS